MAISLTNERKGVYKIIISFSPGIISIRTDEKCEARPSVELDAELKQKIGNEGKNLF